MVFRIDHVSSGNSFLGRHTLDNKDVEIYYVRFLDGRIIPFTKTDIARCRKITTEERIELL